MKIPETTANVGAYYGNEENGQWQPNGVMLDSGVGGGVVGSGDAGVQRPMYPVHMPRQHMPGYVMAGAYYAGPGYAPPPDDFADYMWMENEEEFDKQVMQQLEEEALMEQCIEAMLEDEQRERLRPNGHQPYPTTSNGAPSLSLEETVSRSRLNPLAAEFVPVALHTPAEEKKETTTAEAASTTVETPQEKTTEHQDTAHTEPQKDPTPPPADPPEVSAADIQTDDKRRDKKDSKKHAKEARPTVRTQPQTAHSDSKLGKKEEKAVRPVKSEDGPKAQQPALPAPVEEPSGPKPINYAAAAKANKPKKPSPPSPPVSDKTSPPPAPPKVEKKKVEKPVQRKNSTK